MSIYIVKTFILKQKTDQKRFSLFYGKGQTTVTFTKIDFTKKENIKFCDIYIHIHTYILFTFLCTVLYKVHMFVKSFIEIPRVA